jgi:RHS repeat-associated protein
VGLPEFAGDPIVSRLETNSRILVRKLWKNNEASDWSLRQERRFLYDESNMIAESSRGTEARWTDGTAGCPGGVRARAERTNQLDVPSSGAARLHRSYAWGLDASGTLTGAGGVGGLLLTSHHTPQADGGMQVTTLAPLYDFNGNVLAYADVATSTITHRMEYDPFGQELSLDTLLPGEGAAEAPRFRFSTKYTDGETGLVYYGYRSYSPELGRWVNRDPIEERGGINLYGMVGNDAVNRVDELGLAWFSRDPTPQEECEKRCKTSRHCESKGSTLEKAETKAIERKVGFRTVGGLIEFRTEITYRCTCRCKGECPCPFPIDKLGNIHVPNDGIWRLDEENNELNNVATGERLQWDDHRFDPKIQPHWDYKDRNNKRWRIFMDSTMCPK